MFRPSKPCINFLFLTTFGSQLLVHCRPRYPDLVSNYMDCSPDTETHCSPRYTDISSVCPDSETAVLSGYRVTSPCPDTESGRNRLSGYRDPSVLIYSNHYFLGPIFNVYKMKAHLNTNHLPTMTII